MKFCGDFHNDVDNFSHMRGFYDLLLFPSIYELFSCSMLFQVRGGEMGRKKHKNEK
jgi:hypothetical protein